jgi:RND family efflux transporter MFP subunit
MKTYASLAVALLGLIAYLYQHEPSKPSREKPDSKPKIIDITSVETKNYPLFKNYIGTLYPASHFKLNAKIGGRIVDLHCEVGDPIKNGQTIASIDNTIHRLELNQAQARLKIEQAKLMQIQKTIVLSRKDTQRMQTLRDQQVISVSALEQSQYQLEQKLINLEGSQAQVSLQETAVKMSELRLAHSDIKAQWSDNTTQGYVLAERYVDVGETVTPNNAVASIMDIGHMNAEIFVGEQNYPKFSRGMKVCLNVEAFPGLSFQGEVSQVAPFINEQTRQAKVLIRVENPEHKLRPGMFARTRVIFEYKSNLAMIPRSCVVDHKGKTGVFLFDDKKNIVRFQTVNTGIYRHQLVQIVNEEALNAPIVSVGQHMLKNGDSVKLVTKEQGLTANGNLEDPSLKVASLK